MKKLKDLGFTWPVVIIALVIFGVIGYSLFDPSTSFGRAPLFNKLLGTGFFVAAIGFVYLSSKDVFFNDIKNDRVVTILRILITAGLLVGALLTWGVFHSGPLGTLENPF